MPLTEAMRNFITADAIGETVTEFNNANAHLGVGDSTAAFAAAQTDLQATTNKFRKAMDATYPTRATNVLTFKATFATTEANFTWAEWGVFNAASGGTMFNRKVEALGSKTVTASWALTVTLTLTAA